jgi:retron-type reverse transcriptase
MLDLYQELTSFQSLLAAFRRARRGKRGTAEEAAFYLELEPNLFRLSRELRAQTWVPDPYTYFSIRDPKPRTISVATFRDRVVHHSLIGALEPVFEPMFYRHSYACRRDKGTHRALAWTRHYAGRFGYFLKLDVRKHFDSVSHPVLMEILGRSVSDPGVLWLCRTILDHARVPGAPAEARRGIPIGNLTSQFWGNVYLDPLDRLLRAGWQDLVHLRYMDDVLVFANQRARLWEVHAAVRAFLRDRLALVLKDEATVVAPVTQGIPFLGFRVFPGTTRMQRATLVRFARQARRLHRTVEVGAVGEEEAAPRMSSLFAHAAVADSASFRASFLEGLAAGRGPE